MSNHDPDLAVNPTLIESRDLSDVQVVAFLPPVGHISSFTIDDEYACWILDGKLECPE